MCTQYKGQTKQINSRQCVCVCARPSMCVCVCGAGNVVRVVPLSKCIFIVGVVVVVLVVALLLF